MPTSGKDQSSPIIVRYFTQEGCSVCNALLPKIIELIAGLKLTTLEIVDLKKESSYSGLYSVFTIPTIIVFAEGKESFRLSRSFSVYELGERLERLERLLT